MDSQSFNALGNFFVQNPSLFVGFILPPIIDLLNKDIPKERETERFLATGAICLAIAAIFNVHQIMTNSWGQLATSFALIFTQSQAAYKLYFKNSALRSKLLDRITSPDDSPDNTPEPAG